MPNDGDGVVELGATQKFEPLKMTPDKVSLPRGLSERMLFDMARVPCDREKVIRLQMLL